jgi:hypothetical protein
MLICVPHPSRGEFELEVSVGFDVVFVRASQVVDREECLVLNKRVITAWDSKPIP